MSSSKPDTTFMVTSATALSGRPRRLFQIPQKHEVLGSSMEPPFPPGAELAQFGLGCFWGAERKF